MATNFVLASASTGRLQTLRNAGINPVVSVSDIDEDAVVASLPSNSSAAQVVTALAQAKAKAVAEKFTGQNVLVLGCDSMLEINGQVLGKPHTPEVALERWRQQSGGVSTLHSGHCLILRQVDAPDDPLLPFTEPVQVLPASDFTSAIFKSTDASGKWQVVTASSLAKIHFADLSEAEGHAYVDSGEPLEVAGAFTIDRLGGAFIDHIEGDPHGVVGVSLPLVRRLAQALGVFWPDLWNYQPADS